MPRYGIPTVYGNETYGITSTPSLNVYPFVATIIDTATTHVTWTVPVGVPMHRFRLLRNHDGIPDHYEDGTVLFETFDEGPVANQPDGIYFFIDNGIDSQGNPAPMRKGHRVYYTAWIWQTDAGAHKWIMAGVADAVVPDDHSVAIDGRNTATSHEKMMELLPRVFTSAEQNSVDEIDYDSDLSQFLSTMSFTYDEMMTQLELLMPDDTFQHLTPDLLEAAAFMFRLPRRNRPATKYTSRLLRDALQIYTAKGTPTSLAAFIEDLTGYLPQIVYSPNLFLTPQDSTFVNGIGNWTASGTATIEETVDVQTAIETGAATEFESSHTVDTDWSALVTIPSVPTQIENGVADPIFQGIPVSAGNDYSFKFYMQSEDVISVTPIIHWYDYQGKMLDSITGDVITTSSTWTKCTMEVDGNPSILAPDSQVYTWDGTEWVYVGNASVKDSVVFTAEVDGNTVNVIPRIISSYPNYDAFVAGTTSGTYALGDSCLIRVAMYAGVTLEFGDTGSLYLDMMQFAEAQYEEIQEARSVGFEILPEKENLISNPSFEIDETGWTVTNGTATASDYIDSVTIPAISGTPSGDNALKVESTLGDEVSLVTAVDQLIINQNQLCFSPHIYSTAAVNYTGELEVYSVEPYQNFISEADSTPSDLTNWIDQCGSDGAWTSALSTTAGPSATGGDAVVYTITDDPTSGVVYTGIGSDGIVPVEFAGDADYVARIWVKSSIDASFYPQITWTQSTGETTTASVVSTGDTVYVSADEWTQVEYTAVSPTSVIGAEFILVSEVSENEWIADDTIAFAGVEFGYLTHVHSVSWSGTAGEWVRPYTHMYLPELRIPYNKDGLSAEVRIKYTSTGDDVYIDAVQLEDRFTPSDFFDGNYALAGWRGDMHLSPSYIFYNRPEKISQLYTVIRRYIPIGLPYYVLGPDGIQFEGQFKGYA